MSRAHIPSEIPIAPAPGVRVGVVRAILLFQQGARALPQPTDALKFFNNVFVTGGYVVAGVGLWDTGSGTIDMGILPRR